MPVIRFAPISLGLALGLAIWLPLSAVGCGDDGSSSGQGGASSSSSSSGQGGSAGSADGGGGQGGMADGGGGSNNGGGGMGGQGGGCVNSLPNTSVAPDKLSMTGLYADIVNKELSPQVQAYEPQYKLWSDGAEKKRWLYLPECGQIDTSDMDNWNFPVGARAWKEFSLNGVRLETRMLHRFGPGSADYLYVTYQWDDPELDGDPNPLGQNDVKGTEHDIPDADSCNRCHGPHPGKGGLPSRYLGISAIQLSHNGPGATIDTLGNDGWLTQSAPVGGFSAPGSAIDQAALGYLHANCANCHNGSNDGLLFPFMDLQLKTGDPSVEMTGAYTTAVNQLTLLYMGFGCDYRIAGMSIADSCIHNRMGQRGNDMMMNNNQMPPLGTDLVDPDGLTAIEQWIGTLPPPM